MDRVLRWTWLSIQGVRARIDQRVIVNTDWRERYPMSLAGGWVALGGHSSRRHAPLTVAKRVCSLQINSLCDCGVALKFGYDAW